MVRRNGPVIQDAIREKKTVTGILEVDFPNGLKTLEYSYIPVFDSNNKLLTIYNILSDQSELVEKVSAADSLISENIAAILTLDRNGDISKTNPAFVDVSHISQEQLISMNIKDFKVIEREGKLLNEVITSKKSSKGRLVIDFGWSVRILSSSLTHLWSSKI